MKNKGYFIIWMFFIMVILSALAAAYSSFVVKQLQHAKTVENDLVLRHIAESGIRFAQASLYRDAAFRKTPVPVSCGRGEFTVEIIPRGDAFIIRSCARADTLEKTIERTYKKEDLLKQ